MKFLTDASVDLPLRLPFHVKVASTVKYSVVIMFRLIAHSSGRGKRSDAVTTDAPREKASHKEFSSKPSTVSLPNPLHATPDQKYLTYLSHNPPDQTEEYQGIGRNRGEVNRTGSVLAFATHHLVSRTVQLNPPQPHIHAGPFDQPYFPLAITTTAAAAATEKTSTTATDDSSTSHLAHASVHYHRPISGREQDRAGEGTRFTRCAGVQPDHSQDPTGFTRDHSSTAGLRRSIFIAR